MDIRPIVFLDSGIGGLPYFMDFHAQNPGEWLLYFADRAHFPYGSKCKEALSDLLRHHVALLIRRFNPKLVVLACNTASVSSLETLRKNFPELHLVGTVPAVKPAVSESRSAVVGVLGTPRTIDDPYIADLARQYGPECRIEGIAAPDLVDFVEKHSDHATPAEKEKLIRPYIEEFRRRGADAVVLGCTHFLFLLPEFISLAKPDIRIYDSVNGVSQRIQSILSENNLNSETQNMKRPMLLLTGGDAPGPIWEERAATLGFDISLFGDDVLGPGVTYP